MKRIFTLKNRNNNEQFIFFNHGVVDCCICYGIKEDFDNYQFFCLKTAAIFVYRQIETGNDVLPTADDKAEIITVILAYL